MRIVRAELFELVLPLAQPFAISGGVMRERRSLIVVLRDADGYAGYGEAPPFETPFYSEETIGTARTVLTDLLLPRVLGREFEAPADVDAALRDGVRGNPFARSAVETAAWDLVAHRRGVGLATLLGEALRVPPAAAISCGVALGIPADREPTTLARQVADAVAAGYRRVKIKIAPGWDVAPVRAAAAALGASGIPLTVDANGAYRWPEDEAALRALDGFGLLYIEQPLAPDALVGHARMARALRTPICLDETLRSVEIAREVVATEGPRIWNVKVHRVGGLSETGRIVQVAAEAGVALWAGTMPESGIGSQAALAMAAMPQCVYPSDLEPSARWYGAGRDVVELHMATDGTMPVPRVSVAGQLDPERFRSAAQAIVFCD